MRQFTILLLLLAVACYNESDHDGITNPGPAGILSVTASPSSIPADGASISTITARIDPRTPPASRGVSFRTTVGTFIGFSASEGGRTAAVTADENGEAKVTLRSSMLVESATVTATHNSFVATANVDFTPVVIGNIITLRPSATQAPGDGATIVPITAEIASNLVERSVKFTANEATFLPENKSEITITANTSNRATVDLKAPYGVKNIRVTATVSGVTAETTIAFVAAPPDGLTLTPKAFDVKEDSTVIIDALLTRAPGTVTPGHTLTYTAVDGGGIARGFFANASASNNTGAAAVTWVPNNTPAGTVVTITGRVNGTNVTGQTTVRVIPK